MMRIKDLSIERMRNEVHFQFHTGFVELVEKFTPEALKIQPIYKEYLPLYKEDNLAFKIINKSTLTVRIKKANKARKQIWKGLTNTNKGALMHFDEAVQASAQRLKIVFDTYGNIHLRPMTGQTSAIRNILQEFEGKYARDVAVVGLAQWVAELKARNIAFHNLVLERDREISNRVSIVLREARARVDEKYRAIVRHINALAEVEGADAYEAFIRNLNTYIARFAVLMAHAPKRPRKKS